MVSYSQENKVSRSKINIVFFFFQWSYMTFCDRMVDNIESGAKTLDTLKISFFNEIL